MLAVLDLPASFCSDCIVIVNAVLYVNPLLQAQVRDLQRADL